MISISCALFLCVCRFRKDYPQKWLGLRTDFEMAKKVVKPDVCDSCITLEMPRKLCQIYEEVSGRKLDNEDLELKCGMLGVDIDKGTLYIYNETVATLFYKVTKEIADLVQQVLTQPKLVGCKFVMLVGGFSESRFLQVAVKTRMERTHPQVAMLVPHDSQTVVVKGALAFGHDPNIVVSRISRYTYGYRVCETFRVGYHDINHHRVIEGKAMCGKIFCEFVKQGDEVLAGTTKTAVLYPSASYHTSVSIQFFALDGEMHSPQYTDDPRVHEVQGGFTVPMPNTTGGTDRPVELAFSFGCTEIKISARDVTHGAQQTSSVQFESV